MLLKILSVNNISIFKVHVILLYEFIFYLNTSLVLQKNLRQRHIVRLSFHYMMKNLRCKSSIQLQIQSIQSFHFLFRNLNAEQRHLKDGLLLFSVKDKDLLGYNNQYIGEAFLNFADIKDTNEPLSSLPQVRLQLSRPTNSSKYKN